MGAMFYEMLIPHMRREILRCAQNDNSSSCHSERSEESPARSRSANLTHGQKLFFDANRTLQEHSYLYRFMSEQVPHLQEKSMPKRHQQRIAKEQAGRN